MVDSMDKQTPEQGAKAALASLTASVKRTPTTSVTTSRQRGNQSQEPTMPSSSASTKLMARLWVLMTEMYGHKWVSTHGESDSGTWGKVLYDVNGQQIAQGMQACACRGGENAAWPPSAPEFREMCLAGNSALGIPTADRAWSEACEASVDPTVWKFSHPIVQEAGRKTDWYAIRHGIPKAIS